MGNKFKQAFSVDEQKRIHRLMQETWDYVGSDCLDANDGNSLLRDDVIEIVLDAGYLEDTAKRSSDSANVELIARFRKLMYVDQIDAARHTFKYRSYGY